MNAKFLKSDWLQKSLAGLTVLSLVLSILAPAIALPTLAFAVGPVTLFEDGFESEGFSEWTSYENKWSVSSSNAHSGDEKANAKGATGESGNSLVKEISTESYENLTLSFWYKVNNFEDDDDDRVVVEYTVNGTDWTEIYELNDSHDDNTWHQVSESLPEGAEDNTDFTFRFKAVLDAGNDDFKLDDVLLTGELIPEPTGSISGYKWDDQNNNGIWEEEELALENWPINLYFGEESSLATTTDADGHYEFVGLDIDTTYEICEELTEGWLQSYPLIDQDGVIECENDTLGYSFELTEEFADFSDINFGNYQEEDTTTPNVPSLVSPSDGVTTTPTGLILDWSDETDPSSPVTYIYRSSLDSATTTDNMLSNELYESGSLSDSQIDASGSSDNTYFWQVKACDSVGNCSDWSGPWKVIIDSTYEGEPEDTTPPLVPELVSPADGATVAPTGLVLDWTDVTDPSSPVTYDYQSSHSNTTTTDNALSSPIYNSNDQTDSEIDASSSADDTYFWQVRACDSVGNCSDWSDPWQVIIDSEFSGGDGDDGEGEVDEEAPRVVIDFPKEGDKVYGEVLISGIISDENPAHYWLRISGDGFSYTGGPGTVTQTESIDATSTIYAWDTTGLDEGWYFIKLEARDAEGNKSPDLSPVPSGTAYPDANTDDSIHWVRVKVDHDHLWAPNLVSPADGAFVQGDVLTNSWEAVPDAVKYKYRSYDAAEANGSDIRWTQYVDAPATSKTATNVAESTFWWRVLAVDDDGDEFDWSELWKVTVDNTAPTTTIDSPAPDTEWLDEILISGTTTDNHNVGTTTIAAAIYDGEVCGEFSDLVSITNSDPNSLPFAWSYPWSPDEESAYCIKAYGEDLAGNVEGTALVMNVVYKKTSSTDGNTSEDDGGSSGGGYYNPPTSGQGGGETGFTLPEGEFASTDLAGTGIAGGIDNPDASGNGLIDDEDENSTTTDDELSENENGDVLAAAGLFGGDNWWLGLVLLLVILLGGGWYWYAKNKGGSEQTGMF